MHSNHRSIQDSTTTLPQPNGDRDYEQTFDAPGLKVGETRPYLSYRVNPADDRGVKLLIALNDKPVVDQTIDTGVSRTFNEIFDENVLKATGNKLTVTVPNTAPGSLEISDLFVVYSAS